MTFLFSHTRVVHARLHASSGKNTALKRCPSCPFVLNGLVLSILTLKSPFWPVLWPFCPKVRVMIYSAKRNQGLRPTTSETPLTVQEEEKDTIVHHLSTPRGVKKSLKSLPKGLKKSLKSLP